LEKYCKNLLSVGSSAREPRLPPAAVGSATRPPRRYSLLLSQLYRVFSSVQSVSLGCAEKYLFVEIQKIIYPSSCLLDQN